MHGCFSLCRNLFCVKWRYVFLVFSLRDSFHLRFEWNESVLQGFHEERDETMVLTAPLWYENVRIRIIQRISTRKVVATLACNLVFFFASPLSSYSITPARYVVFPLCCLNMWLCQRILYCNKLLLLYWHLCMPLPFSKSYSSLLLTEFPHVPAIQWRFFFSVCED